MAITSVPEILADLRQLTVDLPGRAEDIEATRRLPADVVESLIEAGAMRMLVPPRYGGPGLSLPGALTVIEELARADAATGWTVGQVTLAQLIFASFPAEALTEVYASGPDTLGAGAVAPKGRATARGEQWRVTGQWPFVTGCWYASWAYMTCVEFDGRSVVTGPDGSPLTRMVLVPAGEFEILDTWHAVGLRGTASHDVRVAGSIRPAGHTLTLAGDDRATANTRDRIAQAGLLIAAVNVGLARGALADVLALAGGGKRPAFSRRRLADSPNFQDRVGEAELTCAAARALLHAEAEAADARAGAAEPASPLARARLRASAARVASLTREVVETAYQLGGGSAVYDSSPLQRRLRDMHASTQHFVNGRDHYAVLGSLLGGADVDPARV